MRTSDGYGARGVLSTTSPKIRHAFLWRACVLLLLTPSLLTLTLAGTGLSATGATSALISPGVGIGTVRLGMTVREVKAILGSPTPGKGGQLTFPRWAMTVSFVDSVATQIWTTNRLFRTKYGAGVGISRADAARLVGDSNSVATRSGNSLTVLFAFQGIGFVFRGDHAIAVYVKPPLTPGSASMLGPSQPSSAGGTTQRVRGRGSDSGSVLAFGDPVSATGGGALSGALGGGGTPIGGGGTSSGGGSTGSSGSTGSGGGSSISVSVDGNGNLVVNGVPFLLIQGTNTDYGWWYTAGYTQAQADAKMAQMVANGFNTNFTPWQTMDTLWPGGDPTLYQDVLMWNRHGLYQHGGATLDDQSVAAGQSIADYGIPNNPDIVRIMNRFKSRPNLLLWWIANEYNYDPTSAAKYCTGANTVKGQDPARSWGDVVVNSMTAAQWEQFLGSCMPVTWVEEAIATTTWGTGEAFVHLYDGLTVVNQAWNDGYRFVLGFSTTPIAELDPAAAGDGRDCTTYYNATRVPTQAEIHRYFMYQVASNVMAFDMLWGPNQRCSAVPLGDSINPAYLAAWNNTMTEMSRVKSLASVILAPGRWQPVVTTPAFVPYAPSPTNNDFKGIYAAKKAVASKIYIVACNVDFHQDPVTSQWTENAISKATIDVGRRITSVTRLFESAAPPSFSGSVISDSFVPMGVHVYVATLASP